MYCAEKLEPIRSIEDLHYNLQLAIELEFSTLPAYLTALYSIHEGTNERAYKIIRSVVMEEMFHLVNAANVLLAVGGAPALNDPKFLPTYPTYLPDGEKWFQAELLKFSPEALKIFLDIESPEELLPQQGLTTIGEFYENIQDGIRYLYEKHGASLFKPESVSHQVTSQYYYGGGGIPNLVTCFDSAMFALNAIVAQGEGVPKQAWNPDEPLPIGGETGIGSGNHQLFNQHYELAHYYRFNELYQGRYYATGDSYNSGPSGPEIPIDYAAVYNIVPNAKSSDYAAFPEIAELNRQFNGIYSQLLDQLHLAFNGEPELLVKAVTTMFSLKYAAQQLMRVPLPDGSGLFAAPSWEYLGSTA